MNDEKDSLVYPETSGSKVKKPLDFVHMVYKAGLMGSIKMGQEIYLFNAQKNNGIIAMNLSDLESLYAILVVLS
jgi:hypothetical protein